MFAAPQVGFGEGFAVAGAKEVAAIVVAPGVIEARLIGAGAQLAEFVHPDGGRIAAKRLSDFDRRMLLAGSCEATHRARSGPGREHRGRGERAPGSERPTGSRRGAMERRGGDGRAHRPSCRDTPGTARRDDDRAEGADSDQELSRPVAMEAVGMAQHRDDDHDQQRRHQDAGEEAWRPGCGRESPRAGGCGLVDQAERLEERNDGKHADERPAGQHQKMAGEHGRRPEPAGLIGIGIDVHEAEIGDQSPGGGADVAAARDDGQRRPAQRRDLQPRAAIADAQQQPWIAAYRVIAEQLQPGLGGEEPVPRNGGGRRAAGRGDRCRDNSRAGRTRKRRSGTAPAPRSSMPIRLADGRRARISAAQIAT